MMEIHISKIPMGEGTYTMYQGKYSALQICMPLTRIKAAGMLFLFCSDG